MARNSSTDLGPAPSKSFSTRFSVLANISAKSNTVTYEGYVGMDKI